MIRSQKEKQYDEIDVQGTEEQESRTLKYVNV